MAEIFISGRAALEDFMAGLARNATQRIERGGHTATRKLLRSIVYEVSDQVAPTGTLYAAHYWRWVGNGRGPGKMPPEAPIVQWLKAKGLVRTDREARRRAYLVRREIGRRGTLDYQLGGKNQLDEAIREEQPGVERVVAAYLRDADGYTARQFARAFTQAAA